MKPQQMFSDDNDILPDNDEPIPLAPINRFFLGLFALKIGCLAIFFLLLLIVALVLKFSGDPGGNRPADAVEGFSDPTT